MKKNIGIFLSLLLVSCNNKDLSLNIICPTGAPALAFYNQGENFKTNSTPSNIVALMNSKSNNDIVVIDTITGIKAINNGANYKIAASITFGNFYLVSTGIDSNEILDGDDKIVLFGKSQTPDYLFHFLYGNSFDSNIEYVNNVSDAASCIASCKNIITGNEIDYVFCAEPALNNALNKAKSLNNNPTIYKDIQEEYRSKTNGKSLVQASIFVKQNSNRKLINSKLSEIEESINNLITDPSILDSYFTSQNAEENNAKFGFNTLTIKDSVNRLGLGYKTALEIKDSIDDYIDIFGMEKTNEEIYWK